MADTHKKYQVFVSSTFEDLQLERQEVMHALLELDCIPLGMELFPAANEDQWTLIKKVIDDCDYYIVIVDTARSGRRESAIRKRNIVMRLSELSQQLDFSTRILAQFPSIYPNQTPSTNKS